jgi:hypothetical protein
LRVGKIDAIRYYETVMNSLRNLKDDALFLGALVSVLAGIALLLETTGFMPLPDWVGPLVVLAAGGFLFYLAIVRKRSAIFFGAGLTLGLVGLVFFLGPSGIPISRSWPLLMTSVGLGWFAFGFWRYGRPRILFIVPSAIFVFLSLFFALFSFGIVAVRLTAFLAIWWPLLIIGGGIALFVAYSLRVGKGKGRRRVPLP